MSRMSDEPAEETWYKIRDLPKGAFIKKQQFSKKVFIKGDYDRASKSYSVTNFEDINDEYFIKADTLVWAGFIY